jgi:hypothetical protein
MTGWDISPSGVKHVLNETSEAAKGLATTGKAIGDTATSAANYAGTIVPGTQVQCGVQGPVAAALGEFFKAYQKDLMYVATRASMSINGAANATNAYIKGNLEMAATAQGNALKEPKIDLPGVTKGQGGR